MAVTALARAAQTVKRTPSGAASAPRPMGTISAFLVIASTVAPMIFPQPLQRAASAKSFNGKLRDELLEREIFDTLLEAKVLIERWRHEYNTIRPHSSLGYRPPAPEAIQPCSEASATLQLQNTAEEQKQEVLS